MGFALAGGLASAAMFAYISGSSFVFIELNGVSPEQFGFFFGANALGLIAASQLNRWLLASYTSTQVLAAALSVTAGAALLLLAPRWRRRRLPADAGAALRDHCQHRHGWPECHGAGDGALWSRAGSASALLGATQFAGRRTGWRARRGLGNGTALPMVGVIALCGVGAWLLLRLLALRKGSAPRLAES
jgi:DHA1 family bicyclomycin/chloramphenicol resistance-like MFS transporter